MQYNIPESISLTPSTLTANLPPQYCAKGDPLCIPEVARTHKSPFFRDSCMTICSLQLPEREVVVSGGWSLFPGNRMRGNGLKFH